MAGYLDQYGAGEDRRESLILRSIVTALILIGVGSLTYYLLKNHHQEGVVKEFLHSIRQGDYKTAYREWGCDSDKACSGYDYNKFLGDWGPPPGSNDQGPPDPGVLGLTDSESCNSGVILTVEVNPKRIEKLWVDKGSDVISFAPYPICPRKNAFAIMLHRTIGQLRKPLLK